MIALLLQVVIAEGPLVSDPKVAFGGDRVLAVWKEGWSGQGATADIRGAWLDPRTLKPRPIDICAAPESQEAPQVAANGDAFIVAWQDFRNGKDYDVRAKLVDGAEILVAGGPGNQARPAVAACGDGFLVVWQETRPTGRYGIRGRRISAGGELLEVHSYAEAGATPAVAGNLVIWGSGGRRGSTSAALVDPKTGKLARGLGKINAPCQFHPAVAADGAGNYMTAAARAPYPDPWGWGGPGAVACSRVTAAGQTPESKLKYGYRSTFLSERKVPNVVDAARWKGAPNGKWIAGVVGGFPGTEDGLWPTGPPAVAYAGDGVYLFAWARARIASDRLSLRDRDVWIRGLDGGTLAERGALRKAAGERGVDESHPALAAGPGGKVLLIYERPGRIVAVYPTQEKGKTPPPGYRALFNGRDLKNWRGQIAEDPRDIVKITKGLSEEEIKEKQEEADRKTFAHWKAENGVIHYDGARRIGNIETREHFGDFELYVDWKIPPKGDSGVFPRNMPQVQIWDPAGGKRNVVGSGGLDNNGPNIPPKKKADKPVGQWNTFTIKMVGERIWVRLNGETVIDGEKKGNYWKEFKEPPPKKGPIVLQSHGSHLWFRNIFIRELDGR